MPFSEPNREPFIMNMQKQHSFSVRRLARCAMGALALAGVHTSQVHAAGVEDLVPGAIGTGRAAAVGRANDFLATSLNPANLAVVPRNSAGFEGRVPVLQSCYDRAYDPNVKYKQPGIFSNFVGSESLGEECNRAKPTLAGNIGWASPVGKKLGLGVGVFTPAGVGSSRYGSNTILSVVPDPNERYTPTINGTESATRQMGLARDGLTAYLMAGVGYRPIPQLRIGVSLGYGVASIYSRSVVSVQGGTFRDQEVVAEAKAVSWFVPRATGSIVLTPHPALDFFAVGTYQGDINAKGNLDVTANGIQGAPRTNCRQANPGTHCRIDGIEINVPFPTAEVTAGLRYSMARRARGRGLDPMRDEYFDLEIQGMWTQTSAVDAFKVQIHNRTNDDPLVPKVQMGNSDTASFQYIKQSTQIPKNWNDTLSVRVGSDVQVVPGRLTLRAGASWASSAVPPAYMNIDYWPVQKIGLHAGMTVAITRFQITAGYAHILYQPVTVPVGTGRVLDDATSNPTAATAVNEGRYRAAQNVFSLQVNAAF